MILTVSLSLHSVEAMDDVHFGFEITKFCEVKNAETKFYNMHNPSLEDACAHLAEKYQLYLEWQALLQLKIDELKNQVRLQRKRHAPD